MYGFKKRKQHTAHTDIDYNIVAQVRCGVIRSHHKDLAARRFSKRRASRSCFRDCRSSSASPRSWCLDLRSFCLRVSLTIFFFLIAPPAAGGVHRAALPPRRAVQPRGSGEVTRDSTRDEPRSASGRCADLSRGVPSHRGREAPAKPAGAFPQVARRALRLRGSGSGRGGDSAASQGAGLRAARLIYYICMFISYIMFKVLAYVRLDSSGGGAARLEGV